MATSRLGQWGLVDVGEALAPPGHGRRRRIDRRETHISWVEDQIADLLAWLDRRVGAGRD